MPLEVLGIPLSYVPHHFHGGDGAHGYHGPLPGCYDLLEEALGQARRAQL